MTLEATLLLPKPSLVICCEINAVGFGIDENEIQLSMSRLNYFLMRTLPKVDSERACANASLAVESRFLSCC